MLIYLAQPIDQVAQPAEPYGVAAAVDEALERVKRPTAVFRPGRAWAVAGMEPNPHLQDANLDVLNRVDLLLAVVPAGVPTLGVTIEIAYAIRYRVPVVVYSDLRTSWTLSWIEHQPGVVVVRHNPYQSEQSTQSLVNTVEYLELMTEDDDDA